eukprot:superscaffoldBa00004623_g19196
MMYLKRYAYAMAPAISTVTPFVKPTVNREGKRSKIQHTPRKVLISIQSSLPSEVNKHMFKDHVAVSHSLFDYYGTSGVEWGLHFPAANGEYQSPINLNSREAQYDPSLLDVGLSPNYVVCRDCEVINDGHTVRIILKSKS